MNRLTRSFEFQITPVPPYNFDLTARRPTGWSLFTPFEIYENDILWTATHLDSTLAGIKLSSNGSVSNPKVLVRIFSRKEQKPDEQENVKRLIGKALGADQDLSEFYGMARKDSILKHVIDDLYGMHDTFSITIFPEAVLAILLQMAPLKRSNEMMACFIQKYGEVTEFEGKKILAWPTPKRISKVTDRELAENCKVGYRAKNIVSLARKLAKGDFPTSEQILEMDPDEAKKMLLELPGIGDYSADIINPHGGFPIDVWSAEVFAKLFFDKKPHNNREAVDKVKNDGLKRWGKWSWMAFYYIVQDLPNLSKKLKKDLRLS